MHGTARTYVGFTVKLLEMHGTAHTCVEFTVRLCKMHAPQNVFTYSLTLIAQSNAAPDLIGHSIDEKISLYSVPHYSD